MDAARAGSGHGFEDVKLCAGVVGQLLRRRHRIVKAGIAHAVCGRPSRTLRIVGGNCSLQAVSCAVVPSVPALLSIFAMLWARCPAGVAVHIRRRGLIRRFRRKLDPVQIQFAAERARLGNTHHATRAGGIGVQRCAALIQLAIASSALLPLW